MIKIIEVILLVQLFQFHFSLLKLDLFCSTYCQDKCQFRAGVSAQQLQNTSYTSLIDCLMNLLFRFNFYLYFQSLKFESALSVLFLLGTVSLKGKTDAPTKQKL